MKELSIEEKAKRYDEAIIKFKPIYDLAKEQGRTIDVKEFENIFPELKKFEDDDIKKWLIGYFNQYIIDGMPQVFGNGLNVKDVIAWLEKQGEQKSTKNIIETWKNMRLEVYQQASGNRHEPNYSDDTTKMFSLDDIDEIIEKISEQKTADKYEPKFHGGEWLCENEPNNYARFIQILEIVSVQGKEGYRISRDIHNDEDIVRFNFVEKYYHKFGIKDAKDGDVLATQKGYPFIYDKNRYNNGLAYYYAGLDVNKELTLKSPHNMLAHFGELRSVSPATKEQRDLLFQKIKEAGYEWDVEKKELKEIKNEEYNGEDYGIDSLFHAQRILEKTLGSVDGYQSDDGILEHKCAISAVKKLYKQTPAWSEEDNVFFKAIIRDIENVQYISEDAKRDRINWLKFLKERVQPQLKQEWSEENKERISMLLDLVSAKEESMEVKLELIIFLKSLKNRMSTQTWKPSEEQMEALDDFIYAKYLNIEKHGAAVKSLYQDLKKLKVE